MQNYLWRKRRHIDILGSVKITSSRVSSSDYWEQLRGLRLVLENLENKRLYECYTVVKLIPYQHCGALTFGTYEFESALWRHPRPPKFSPYANIFEFEEERRQSSRRHRFHNIIVSARPIYRSNLQKPPLYSRKRIKSVRGDAHLPCCEMRAHLHICTHTYTYKCTQPCTRLVRPGCIRGRRLRIHHDECYSILCVTVHCRGRAFCSPSLLSSPLFRMTSLLLLGN